MFEKRKSMDQNEQIIPLNLIYDYPVFWSEYKVLRDFVQNFYDAIDSSEWNQRFKCVYANHTLSMEISDVSFSYEWLVPIGASTKRSDNSKYAGYFGEGFKIASLNALREYNWGVSGGSSDWLIDVTTAEISIDGKKLKTLAYKLEKREPSPNTTLTIRNMHVSPDLVNSVLLSFFYPENELFGEKIWESEEGAIFKRSDVPLPSRYVYTSTFGKSGIVFSSYQAAGSIDVPLVLCNHTFDKKDRDRKELYDFDVISLILTLVYSIDAQASFVVLEYFKRHWYSYDTRSIDLHSFYGIISTLVKNLSHSRNLTAKFKEKYPRLLVADQIKRNDIVGINRRSQALSWKHRSEIKYKLVQRHFKLLGYPLLEDECEKDGGYTVVKTANEEQLKYIRVLEECASAVYGDFFGFEKLPECKIIQNENAAWMGLANCFRRKEKRNNHGHALKYTMDHIAIKQNMLQKGLFSLAFATYMHELCHVFGGDASSNYSRALSDILTIQLLKINDIAKFSSLWNAL
jgi:hypothetical protein